MRLSPELTRFRRAPRVPVLAWQVIASALLGFILGALAALAL